MSTNTDRLETLREPRPLAVEGPTFSDHSMRRAFRIALLTSDMLMLTMAFWLAYWLRFDLQISVSPEVVPSPQFYTALVTLLMPVWLGLFAMSGLYDWQNLLGGTIEYARAFNACTTAMMLVVVATFVDPTFVVARGWLIAAWLLSVFLVCVSRFCIRRIVYAFRRKGYFLVPAAIVGTNGEATALAEQLKHRESSGYHILGAVDPLHQHVGDDLPVGRSELPILGSLEEIRDIIRCFGIRELIVAATSLQRDELLDLYERVHSLRNVELRLSTGLFEVLTTGVQVRSAGFVPLISLNKLRLDPLETATKTAVEYFLTAISLIVLAPVLAVISTLIKLDSSGPVLHRRRVLGVGGKEFDAFKFRTMFLDGDRMLESQPELLSRLRTDEKLKRDPRVTGLGRWLRKYSLDELPQLFNVLLGQMSLVGPRMISPREAEKYGRHRSNLLTVKPGITGLWQVSGRSDLSYDERVRLDMHYIRNYTIWLDLQILFIRTAGAVLKGRGAY